MPSKTRRARPLWLGLILVLALPVLAQGLNPSTSVLGIHFQKPPTPANTVTAVPIVTTTSDTGTTPSPLPSPTSVPKPASPAPKASTVVPKATIAAPKLSTPAPTTSPAALPVPNPTVAHVASGSGRYGISYGDTLAWETPALLAQTLDDAVSVGVGWIRMDLSWDHIQPTSATAYRWSNYDQVISDAQARHLNVLLVVAYTPAWARLPGCTSAKCRPADPNTYAGFAQAAVARYAPLGVHSWEIWNEPNAGYYWQPAADVSQYVALVRAAVPAMKALDPGATVISGGLAPKATGSGDISQLDFLAAFCGQGGTQFVDAIGFHPYASPVLPSYNAKWNAWQQIENTAVSFRSILASCGSPNTKVWLTEYGAPTAGPGAMATATNLLISGPVRSDHVSQDLQAQMAADSVRLAKASSIIGGLFWYTYMDTPGTARSDSYGLRQADGTTKLAYWALRAALAGP